MKSPRTYPLRPAGSGATWTPPDPAIDEALDRLFVSVPEWRPAWQRDEADIRTSLDFANLMGQSLALLRRWPAALQANSAAERAPLTAAQRAHLEAEISGIIAPPPVPGMQIVVLGPTMPPVGSALHQPGMPAWGVGAVGRGPDSSNAERPAMLLVASNSGGWSPVWMPVPHAAHPDFSARWCHNPPRSPWTLVPWVRSLLDVAAAVATIDAARRDRDALVDKSLGLRASTRRQDGPVPLDPERGPPGMPVGGV
ncbi:MAG: hypothetical protein IT518_29255 [Burkholderiales bacterium]|nr:hypothetical protein [Burkholderiales bacterium]